MKKTILNLFLLVMLISSSGCISRGLIQTARGKPTDDVFVVAAEAPDGKPHPEYYPFLIATVPLDAATLPFQAIGYGLMAIFMSGHQ
jgi:hypothetical protein